jgi:signal transduction histidine kinase/DNA-binding response OmpR family regulator
MRRRERDLEALQRVAVACSGVLDPDALGRLVIEQARGLLQGDEATLLWWDTEANGLRVLGDTYIRPFPRLVAVGEGTAGIAFQRGEPVVVEDYSRWEHAVKDSLSRGLKSVVAVPLVVRSVPVGALTVSFNSVRKFQTEDLRFLALLATQVAPALEAARLHDSLVRVSKELERTNTELKDANRHKSAFLANMSHELRTPLNAAIGFSELLSDAREGQFDEATRKRFLTQILTSGRHLLGLINDVLDLSKVEAGQMVLKLQTVSVAETVEQVARIVEPLLGKKRLQLKADLADAGVLSADAGKLKQMLLNLVSNAIKFTPDGGTVTIAAVRTQDRLELSVADTGIGIAEADQEHLFEEFHQVDTSAGRKPEGTGLGLALTRRFALLHGGDVRVSSEQNKGSVFTITLPLRGPATQQAAPATHPAVGHTKGSGPLVLLVEDDQAAAELLTRQLGSAGYRTEIARTGREALVKARELQPLAITLDILLPELDGWEVITRLKSDKLTSSIPIFVVSVVENPELGKALGAIDYLVKPVDAKELVRRMRRFTHGPSTGQKQARVLVVDDEQANRDWLTEALEPAGFSVLTASGGREAIRLAKSHHPDLVLLDMMMPEVSGFDVVEALRADAATRETPIMVLTAANLSDADKQKLAGRVSSILSRGSTGTADLVGLIGGVVAASKG